MTTSTKIVNRHLTTVEQDIVDQFEKKINSIYTRGGLSALKSRQIFINAATDKLQLRLQHIQMMFKDVDVLSTKGVLAYYIRTPKKTNFKEFDTNKNVLKKFFYVLTNKTESSFAIRDYYISERSNVDFNLLDKVTSFEMPAFTEIHSKISQMVINKELTAVEADFSLDYFCFLSKCLGKQPRFTLTLEQALKVKEFALDPEWIQDTFDKSWIVIDPSFKMSKVDLAAQKLAATA